MICESTATRNGKRPNGPGRPPEPPTRGTLACRSAVHDQAGAISEPGEEPRRVPSRSLTVMPQQPKRLRGKRDHIRVKVEQHHLLTFKPRLEADMLAGRGRPPQARKVALALTRRKPADRLSKLKTGPPSPWPAAPGIANHLGPRTRSGTQPADREQPKLSQHP